MYLETQVKEWIGFENHKLVGDRRGPEDAPPVIFLHGGGQTRHSWGGAASIVAQKGWQTISLDLRGHGDSDWSRDRRYPTNYHVEDLRAIVQQLQVPPVLIGASWGGITSLLLEGESPENLCKALVLVDIAPHVEIKGVERVIAFMRAYPDGFGSLEEVADAVASYMPGRPRPKNTKGLEKNLRKRDGRYFWHWDPNLLDGVGSDEIYTQERLETAARAIQVPTLLVRGKLSDIVSEEGAKAFMELVPHAKFTDVSDAGHMVAGDKNDIFTNAILEFMTQL